MSRNRLTPDWSTLIREGELNVPPLQLRIGDRGAGVGEDAVVDVSWQERSYGFIVEYKSDAKPQTLRLAISQAREFGRRAPQYQPMVIAPYLTEEKLYLLLDEGVNGLDLCGNVAIEIPGEMFFLKTGSPNRYRERVPIRSAYRGSGSLVARALILEPGVRAVGEIQEVIRARGGSLSLGMVSKVLKQLEADLAVERPDRRWVRVIQPARLLDGLLEHYQPPDIPRIWRGKVPLAEADLLAKLEEAGSGAAVIRTGDHSAAAYAAYATDPVLTCYCRTSPERVLEQLGIECVETRNFSNLLLLQSDDQRVYFDPRPGLTASPIQAWLELASGDKRQKEMADQVRQHLLQSCGASR